jgi:hypothetical protein
MGIRRFAVAASALAVLAVVSTAAAAPTVTISVTGFADGNGGTCHTTSSTSLSCTTLRAAIINAENYESSAETAVIALSAGTYSLSGDIDIDYGITITGAGMGGAPGGTTIAQTDGVSNVFETNTINTGTVTLENLEITGGHYTTGSGGAINQNGDLTLDSVLVTGNADAPSAPSAANTNGSFGSGGAILEQHGTLTLTSSSVSGNFNYGAPGTGGTSGTAGNGGYAYGGGISMTDDSSLVATNSHIDDNQAIGGVGGSSTGAGTTGGLGGQGIGGGFLMSSTGSVTLTDTTVSGNKATGAVGGGGGTGGAGGYAYGGGLVMNSLGQVILNGVSMIGNTATGGVGGVGTTDGVSVEGVGGAINSGSGAFVIHSSTLADNTAVGGASAGASGHAGSASGGAIDLTTGLEVVNSTIVGNQADAGSAAPGGSPAGAFGGALDIGGNNVSDVLDNDTFSANSSAGAGGAQTQGGNLALGLGTNGKMFVQNTIFVDGGATQPGKQNCELNPPTTGFVDDGHNLEDDTTSQCGLSTADHDVLVASGTAVVAAEPAANGGPTQTLALVPGSPALGAGGGCTDQSMTGATISVDQRGLPRPSSPTTCDIGAFQHQPIGGTLHAAITGKPTLHQTLTCSATGATGDVMAPSFTWLRDGAQIASGSAYVVAAADEGHSLACRASVAGIYGGGLVATSAAVKVGAATPAISGFSQSHSSWTEGSAKARLSAATKKRKAVGTTFRFKLNVAAAVTFTFTHSATGRRSGKRCVAQTKHNRSKQKCTLPVTDGTLTFKPAAGAHALAFDGRLASGKKLAPGKHTVTLSATAGGKSARPAKLSFTILRG